MKGILWIMLAAGGAYAAYVVYQQLQQRGFGPAPEGKKKFVAKTTLQAGSQMTGRVAQTNTGRPPGFGVNTSAYNPKFWAEVLLPTKQKSWIEVVEA